MLDFPSQFLARLRRENKLDDTLDLLAKSLYSHIQSSDISGTEKFCRGYVRAVATKQLTEENFELRKAVYSLIYDLGALRNSSADTLYETVIVYGPTNFKATLEYLNSLPSFFHPKIKRLMIANPQIDPMIASIFFCSSFVDIVTRDFIDAIRVTSPTLAKIARLYISDDVKQLRSLFPQLSAGAAARLLENRSVEDAAQKFLDQETKPRHPAQFKRMTANHRDQNVPDVRAKTLDLAQALLAEEDDDDPEEEELVPAQRF